MKRKNSYFRRQKGSKLKTKEGAVIVRLGNDHLPLLVNGVHIILMIKERLVDILLRHDTRKEYHEKKNTKSLE
jgi:hypothetical protein